MAVTFVCEYLRDPKGISGGSIGVVSSIDIRSDHNHLHQQLSTAFSCNRYETLELNQRLSAIWAGALTIEL